MSWIRWCGSHLYTDSVQVRGPLFDFRQGHRRFALPPCLHHIRGQSTRASIQRMTKAISMVEHSLNMKLTT
jgi:hypothetical protein